MEKVDDIVAQQGGTIRSSRKDHEAEFWRLHRAEKKGKLVRVK